MAQTFVPPRIRTDEKNREMTPTECFWDLIFVLPLQQFFTLTVRDKNEFVLFFMLFLALFNSWLGEAFFNTRFDSDDILSRLMVAVQMVSVAGMASGVSAEALAADPTFTLFYVVLRTILVCKYIRAAWHLPKTRCLISGFVCLFSTAIGLWVASIFVPSDSQASFAVSALLLEYATPFLLLPWMIGEIVRYCHDILPL
jgi:low temperature requirement protein LtrA